MPPKRSSSKKTVTLRLPAELVDELRTFCLDWAGKPYYLKVTTFVEAAISEHLTHLKRQVESAPAGDHVINNDGTPSRR